MESTIVRRAIRTLLAGEGASAVWLTANVVQARAPGGRSVTLVREREEIYAAFMLRAVLAYRNAATPSNCAA